MCHRHYNLHTLMLMAVPVSLCSTEFVKAWFVAQNVVSLGECSP